MTSDNPQYLFDSDMLFYKDGRVNGENFRSVEPLTLVCHNVRRIVPESIIGRALSSQGWEFQIVGEDRWFKTQYDWSLVLNTPENLELVRQRDVLRQARNEVAQRAHAIGRKVINVRGAA